MDNDFPGIGETVLEARRFMAEKWRAIQGEMPAPGYPNGPFPLAVGAVVDYARGTHEFTPGAIGIALRRIYDTLFRVPYRDELCIPETFWRSPFGELCAAAERKARPHAFATISELANITSRSVSSISQDIARGHLWTITVRDSHYPGGWRKLVDLDRWASRCDLDTSASQSIQMATV